MKRIAWRAGCVASIAMVAIAAASGAWFAALAGAPPGFGNRAPAFSAEKVQRLAVFGDSQKGFDNFAAAMARAKQEGAQLAVHTGDLACHADEGHFRLALHEIARADWSVPFLVAPGNHDLKGEPTLFDRHVGPADIRFEVAGASLVILNNGLGPPDLKKVEALLEPSRGPILVFMHVPPLDRPGYEPFHQLIAKYPVRYVFSGHVHEYKRVERNGIIYIINGVGGDYDSWQFDQKVHLTMVDLGERISDRAITLDPRFGIISNLRHWLVGHVARFWIFLLGLAAIFLAFWWRHGKVTKLANT